MRVFPLVLFPIALAIGATSATAATYAFDLSIVDQDVEPSTPGEVISFETPIVNSQGDIAVVVNVSSPGGFTTEIRRYDRFNNYTVVARSGDPAPGTGGATYSGFDNLSMNDNGVVAWEATLSGPETANTNIGVFTGINIGLQNRIVQDGDPVAGTTRTVKLFDDPFLRRFDPVISDTGAVFVSTRVSTPGSTILTDSAILGFGGAPAIVGIEGETLVASSREITDLGIEPQILDGDVVMIGSGIDFTQDALIRSGSLGYQSVIERSDIVDGYTIQDLFFSDVEVDGPDTFGAVLSTNGFVDVFFANFDGALAAYLAEGSPAPVDNGVLSSLFLSGITEAGESIFLSSISGDSGNSSLIYFRDAEGDLSPVFWSEETIEVDGQALALTPLGLNFSVSRMLTDFQSTAFSLDLAIPGAGFRSVLVRAQGDLVPPVAPVPLPAGATLLLTGLGALGLRRKLHR